VGELGLVAMDMEMRSAAGGLGCERRRGVELESVWQMSTFPLLSPGASSNTACFG
jgi:hypothetical protein